MNSSIIFVYDQKINNTSFLEKLQINGISNASSKNSFNLNEKIDNLLDNHLKELEEWLFKNIKVITSDICGLGKSEKIKSMIRKKEKEYLYFPLGGRLTKRITFDKLFKLLKKIKDKEYKKIAIHLDLKESKEISILNEFFFSFLITKFYTHNENIIYIPIDIEIYIEIANCFEDYLSKFDILNSFIQENITIENMSVLNLPERIISIFKRIFGYDSNKQIEKFINAYIDVPKYSYHQINIFIQIFISRCSNFESQLAFIGAGKDMIVFYI